MESNSSSDCQEWVRRCMQGHEPGVVPQDMVGWYDIGHLLRTGINILISAALGTRSDVRWMEATTGGGGIIEYEDLPEHGEFWFDYMADTGDGWNSTSRMAYLVGKPFLKIRYDEKDYKLDRGTFLILGGDEVYPCASRQEYKQRLINPFRAAHPRRSLDPEFDRADLYAIPGNHDWYDGLVSFMRQFQQGRDIGIWRTKQTRSYFALKLPCNWWLWGVDTQLEADIDWPQVQFFMDAAGEMDVCRENNLIVCTAEPYWIYANTGEQKEKQEQLYNNLLFLLSERVLNTNKVNLYLSLAGDLHHYRRHEDECDRNRQKIVSGGGGAFLHPTHDCGLVQRILVRETAREGQTATDLADSALPSDSPLAAPDPGNTGSKLTKPCSKSVDHKRLGRNKCGPVESKGGRDASDDSDRPFDHIYRLAAQFPDERASRALSHRIPFFIWYNRGFGLVTAGVYALTAAMILDLICENGLQWPVWHVSYLGLVVVGVAHFGVYYYLCDERKGKRFRILWGGILHGGIQFFAAGAVAYGWCRLAVTSESSFAKLAYLIVGIPVSGYLLGPTLLGLYLLASLNWWKVNQNEAFSALRIEDHKNFVRFCIKRDGSLVIYPIGVASLHDDPVLIEHPITIVPRKTGKCAP